MCNSTTDTYDMGRRVGVGVAPIWRSKWVLDPYSYSFSFSYSYSYTYPETPTPATTPTPTPISASY